MKRLARRLLTRKQRQILSYGLVKGSNLLFKVLRLIGIDAFILEAGYHYVPDYFGRAAHKQEDIRKDPLFGELASEVIKSGRSSLYYDRLYMIYQSLLHLKILVKSQECINLVEAGVYKGGASYFIASLSDRLGLNISHYSFDTFEGHSDKDIDTGVETAHRPSFFGDTNIEDVKRYLSKFDNVFVFKGRIQDTCHNLNGRKIHFAHLDMDIYLPTIFSLDFLDRILVVGGIMLVDDYGFSSCPGIVKAIDEFRLSHPGYFGASLLTGQYLLVKVMDQGSV